MVNCRSIYWGIISLSVTTFLITFSKGASVSLTVEGGVSLVGPHCPGTVRLFCEGVELISLRWRYNGDINIITYFPDSTESLETLFFRPQLIVAQQNPSNRNFANFTSSLTVNVSQLIANNVTEISCSAPGVSQAEPVNVSIIEPGVPNNPTITMVTAAYQSGELNSVEVTWEKSDNFCPSYGLSFIYEVNVTMYSSVLVNHSSDSCDEVTCMISINNFTIEMQEYVISIKAENELGSSDTVVYPLSVGDQVQQYFIPNVFLMDRQLFGRCTTAQGFAGSDECSVQYTTDPMLRDLSNETLQPLNTDFSISLEDSVPETTYYFLFRALVNNTLQITDRIVFTYPVETSVPGYGVALIVLVLILCGVIALVIALLLYFYVSVKKQNQTNESMEERGNQEAKVKDIFEATTVTVEGYERREHVTTIFWIRDVRPYTVFKVVTRLKDKTEPDVVFKQLDDFEELYKNVKKQYKAVVDFPEIDNRFNHDDCQEKLNEFMNELMKIPNILEFTSVQKFLKFGGVDVKGLSPVLEPQTTA